MIRSMDIGTRQLDHIKENHLLQEGRLIRLGKLKYLQQTHFNGNLELIILSLLLMKIIKGEFMLFFCFRNLKIKFLLH